MKKITLSLGLCAALISSVAMAGLSSDAQFINQIQVNGVTGSSIPEGYLFFATAPAGKPACANTNNTIVLVGNLESIKLMTSVSTSAFLAGKKVKVYYDGTCLGAAPLNFAKVVAVQVQP